MSQRHFTPVSIAMDYSAHEIDWGTYRDASDRFGALVFPSDLSGYVPADPHPSAYHLCVGIYSGEDLIGWQYSHEQEGAILMRDTGILPAHQRQGIYGRLLPCLLSHFTQCGFTRVKSRHRFENSAAIIPKLKAGFFIVGTDVEDSVSYVKLAWSAPIYESQFTSQNA